MSNRRPAPADAPSTYVDPEYRKRQRDAEKAAQERYAALCGPVEVRQSTGDDPALTRDADGWVVERG